MVIDPQGDWKSCTDVIPRACEIFGTVLIGTDPLGVLCRLHATGTFVRVLDGEIKVLLQSQVRQRLDAISHGKSDIEMVSVSEQRRP